MKESRIYDLLLDLLNQLIDKDIIKYPVIKLSNILYDEPRCFYYIVYINNKSATLKKLGRSISDREITGSHLSFFSSETALFKSITESLEYLSLFVSDKSDIIRDNFNNLSLKNKNILNPKIYKPGLEKILLSWTQGNNLTNNIQTLLPTQLTTLSNVHDPIRLTNQMSTGSASGRTLEEALIHGIYEIIERDNTMTSYLVSNPASLIDLPYLDNKKITSIINNFHYFNIELKVVDLTNDLDIPTFCAILRDKTDVGSKISVGSKSSFNPEEAIIGAIEEAFMVRYSMNSQIYKNNYKHFIINSNNVNSKDNRLRYWSNPKMEHELDFWMNQPEKKIKLKFKKFQNKKNELDFLIKHLKKMNYTIYYKINTISLLKNISFSSCKVIIPGLQPLYLVEKFKEINKKRIEAVSSYFKIPNLIINAIPHPFP